MMFAQGLRALIGGMAPRMQQAGQAIRGAVEAHPAIAAGVGAAGLGMITTAPKPTARNSARDRWYGSQETHKPHDAYDAYQEDDFMKQAFSAAPDYDTYAAMLQQGGVGAEMGLTPDEFEAISRNPTMAKEYMTPERDINRRLNDDTFGEGWEGKVDNDSYRRDKTRQRHLALQQQGR